MALSAYERAKRSAEAMWANDRASQFLGLEIVEVLEGQAQVSMAVAPQHTNGHGICHGGFLYTLADSAFAFACNSRNQSTVAYHNSMTYHAPAHLGDHLKAVAQERSLKGRNGIYDVEITNQNGDHIASFRGQSRTVKGQLFDEEV